MSATSFRPEHRVKSPADFERIYQARIFAADDVLVVNGAANGLSHPRLGLSVSKKAGNAVVRNRWKRSLREAFRQVRHRLPALDLVVAPRPGIQPVVAELMVSLPSLVGRVEKRLRTGVAPYPPRAKQSKQTKKKPERPQKPASDSPT